MPDTLCTSVIISVQLEEFQPQSFTENVSTSMIISPIELI